MTLSRGQAISDNAWEVPVRDLGDTWVGPPSNFIGFVDLGAELHLSDVIVVYRRPIRLQWAPATGMWLEFCDAVSERMKVSSQAARSIGWAMGGVGSASQPSALRMLI